MYMFCYFADSTNKFIETLTSKEVSIFTKAKLVLYIFFDIVYSNVIHVYWEATRSRTKKCVFFSYSCVCCKF